MEAPSVVEADNLCCPQIVRTLMTTEGDRRRHHLELARPAIHDRHMSGLSELDEYRHRITTAEP